jgi:ubiquinone/menaquinone biosynthesis C-methylase UbiE
MYDHFQRGMRDKGWIETKELLKSGITYGHALEIGPGPGYLGLDWLKSTKETVLTGIDISPDMARLAEQNAREYGLSNRTKYVISSEDRLPFEDGTFEAVFSNGSLHEWEDPRSTLNEMWRVLKPTGRLFVSDLRRDMMAFVKWFILLGSKPREIRPGFITSVNAAYTPKELSEMINGTQLAWCTVSANPIGLILSGVKKNGKE